MCSQYTPMCGCLCVCVCVRVCGLYSCVHVPLCVCLCVCMGGLRRVERIDFKRPVNNDGVISGRTDWSGKGKGQGDHCVSQSVFGVSEAASFEARPHDTDRVLASEANAVNTTAERRRR